VTVKEIAALIADMHGTLAAHDQDQADAYADRVKRAIDELTRPVTGPEIEQTLRIIGRAMVAEHAEGQRAARDDAAEQN